MGSSQTETIQIKLYTCPSCDRDVAFKFDGEAIVTECTFCNTNYDDPIEPETMHIDANAWVRQPYEILENKLS